MTARQYHELSRTAYRASVTGLCAAVLITLLSGCSGKPERHVQLIDQTTGCKWIMVQYGMDGPMSGSYVRAQTDANGEQICEKGGV